MINKLCGDETYLKLSSGDKYNTSVLMHPKGDHLLLQGVQVDLKHVVLSAESHYIQSKAEDLHQKNVFVI